MPCQFKHSNEFFCCFSSGIYFVDHKNERQTTWPNNSSILNYLMNGQFTGLGHSVHTLIILEYFGAQEVVIFFWIMFLIWKETACFAIFLSVTDTYTSSVLSMNNQGGLLEPVFFVNFKNFENYKSSRYLWICLHNFFRLLECVYMNKSIQLYKYRIQLCWLIMIVTLHTLLLSLYHNTTTEGYPAPNYPLSNCVTLLATRSKEPYISSYRWKKAMKCIRVNKMT